MTRILPITYQPPLPKDTLIRAESPSSDAIEMDVLFVGAGPAGLAGAIELARLAKADATVGELNIGVLEKAGSLGEHCLSGAVVNPRTFEELFPGVPLGELPFRQPVTGEAVYLLTERSALRIPINNYLIQMGADETYVESAIGKRERHGRPHHPCSQDSDSLHLIAIVVLASKR